MNSAVIAILCLSIIFVAFAAGQFCTHEAIQLKKSKNEEHCRRHCFKHSDDSFASCFSYAYDISKKTCTGYVFRFLEDENDRLCGTNLGGDLSVENTIESKSKSTRETPNDSVIEDDDILDTYGFMEYDIGDGDDEHDDDTEETKRRSGCVLVMRALGIVVSTKKCKERCAQLESKRYGGCAAWFFDPSEEECTGLLSRRSKGNVVCGSIYK